MSDEVTKTTGDTQSVQSDQGDAQTAGRRSLLVGLLLAVTLHAFAELAIVTVLPIISRDLDGAALYGIAFSSYLLTSLISIVWSGHMTDAKGPVIPFVAGLIVFSIGLIWAGLATNMWIFVLARGVQGLGGGAFSAVIYASINRGWQEHERAHVLALLSSAWVIPGLVAPAAAGAIAEFWSWRLVFILLLPFIAVTLALSLRGLRSLGAGEVHDTGADKTADAFRIAVGISLFLVAITKSFDLWSMVLAVLGVALAWRPLVRVLPPGEGKSRNVLLAALGVKFLLMFGFYGADAFLPLGLIEIHELTAFVAGIVLTVAAVSWSGAAFLQSRLSTSVSPRTLSVAGSLVVAVSILCLTVLLIDGVPYWWGFVIWTVSGFGIGIVYNTVATAAMAHTIKGKEGVTSVAIGLVEGISIALVAGMGGAILNGVERQGQSLGFGIGIIWVICAVVVAAGGWVSYHYLEKKVRPALSGDAGQETPQTSPTPVSDLSQD